MFSVLIFVALLCPSVLGADILAVFAIPSYSHQIVYRALTLELLKRGHSLTVITPDPIKDPNLKNYREIDVSFSYADMIERFTSRPGLLRNSIDYPEWLFVMFANLSEHMCHRYYSQPEVEDLIRENRKYDLTIVEFSLNPCFYAFSKFSDYNYIGIISFQPNAISYTNVGNPVPASYIPDVNFPFLGKMSFYQRFRTLANQVAMWVIHAYYMWTHDKIVRQYLGNDVRDLVDIERNVSLVLVNTHFTMSFPRPNVPNLVEIGGPAIHLNILKRKPLRQVT